MSQAPAQNTSVAQPASSPVSLILTGVGALAVIGVLLYFMMFAGGAPAAPADLGQGAPQQGAGTAQESGAAPTRLPSSDAQAGLPPQGSSDGVAAIEADLKAMDLGALESQTSASVGGI